MQSLTQIRINYEDFNEFLWSHGWKQTSLAEVLGVDNSTISKYTSQGLALAGRMIIAIAQTTRMTAADICTCLLGGI